MRDLIIIALREEAPALAERPDVFFSGVGKVNAAATVSRLIERYHPDRVINFGTAGGITVSHGLWCATKFVQRDMRCLPLGLAPGETPFESTPVVLDLGGNGLTCSTGDSFVTDSNLEITADLVDMEAYAIAKTCWQAGVAFRCWKYVSDHADESASQDWRKQVAAGQSYYLSKLQELDL